MTICMSSGAQPVLCRCIFHPNLDAFSLRTRCLYLGLEHHSGHRGRPLIILSPASVFSFYLCYKHRSLPWTCACQMPLLAHFFSLVYAQVLSIKWSTAAASISSPLLHCQTSVLWFLVLTAGPPASPHLLNPIILSLALPARSHGNIWQ